MLHEGLKCALFAPFVNLTVKCLFLQEAKRVSINKDLRGILSETPGRCIPYAVIEGGLLRLEGSNKCVCFVDSIEFVYCDFSNI